MTWLLRIGLSAGILAIVTLALAGHYYYKGFYRPTHARHSHNLSSSATATAAAERRRLGLKIASQRTYLIRHGFNSNLCFLVDMKIPSGKDRFFVYDLNKDTILLKGLVAHGCGSSNFSSTPYFSNVNGSSCTALGRYRIGFPYQGQFGLAYKLYGLDTTNDQAFVRSIVLHSYTAVPTAETYPYPICNSRGCPMVSPAFLQQLRPVIDKSKKPILLWIFD